MGIFIQGGGGTDTSDATATASDIKNGKTAYVDDEKITGTALAIATTANASKILSGYTAYDNNGKLITGNFDPTKYRYTIGGFTQDTSYQYIRIENANITKPSEFGQSMWDTKSGQYYQVINNTLNGPYAYSANQRIASSKDRYSIIVVPI